MKFFKLMFCTLGLTKRPFIIVMCFFRFPSFLSNSKTEFVSSMLLSKVEITWRHDMRWVALAGRLQSWRKKKASDWAKESPRHQQKPKTLMLTCAGSKSAKKQRSTMNDSECHRRPTVWISVGPLNHSLKTLKFLPVFITVLFTPLQPHLRTFD